VVQSAQNGYRQYATEWLNSARNRRVQASAAIWIAEPDRGRADARYMEASMSKANEWDVLKRQFDAPMHDESVGAESIDEIFDVQFRRRFTDLINQIAQRNSTSVGYNWPRF
jgi:hypothetical protein